MTLTLDNANLVRFFGNRYHRGDLATFGRVRYANGDAIVLHGPRGEFGTSWRRADCIHAR